MLSRFVILFLQRSKCLNVMAVVTIHEAVSDPDAMELYRKREGTPGVSNGKGQRNSMNSARDRNECVLEIGREAWLEMKLFT